MADMGQTIGRMRGGRYGGYKDSRSRNVAMLLASLGGLANLSAVGMKAYQDYMKEERLDKERADLENKKTIQDSILSFGLGKNADYFSKNTDSQILSDMIRTGGKGDFVNPGDLSEGLKTVAHTRQSAASLERMRFDRRKMKIEEESLPAETIPNALADLKTSSTAQSFVDSLPEGEEKTDIQNQTNAATQAKLQTYLKLIAPKLKAAETPEELVALLRPAWTAVPEQQKGKSLLPSAIHQYIDTFVKEDTIESPKVNAKNFMAWMAERPQERLGMIEYVNGKGELDLGSISEAKKRSFISKLPEITNRFKADGLTENEAARRTMLGGVSTMRGGDSYAFDVPKAARPTKRTMDNPAPNILDTHISPTDEMKKIAAFHSLMRRTAKNSEEADMARMFGTTGGAGLNASLGIPEVSERQAPNANPMGALSGTAPQSVSRGQLRVGDRIVPMMKAIDTLRLGLKDSSGVLKNEMRDALLRALEKE